jgi:hypothetical protein
MSEIDPRKDTRAHAATMWAHYVVPLVYIRARDCKRCTSHSQTCAYVQHTDTDIHKRVCVCICVCVCVCMEDQDYGISIAAANVYMCVCVCVIVVLVRADA